MELTLKFVMIALNLIAYSSLLLVAVLASSIGLITHDKILKNQSVYFLIIVTFILLLSRTSQ